MADEAKPGVLLLPEGAREDDGWQNLRAIALPHVDAEAIAREREKFLQSVTPTGH